MNLPNLLAKFRKRHKLTLRQCAERLGVNPRTLEDWAQGRSIPRGLALEALLERIK